MDDHHHSRQLNTNMVVEPKKRGGSAVNRITSGCVTRRPPQNFKKREVWP